MKIILAAKSVYPFHPFGGVQKYVYNYAKYLLKQGIEIEIVSPFDRYRKRRSEIFEGIRYTFLPPAIYKYIEYPVGWIGVHLFSKSLAKYLSQINFDLLHAFDMTGYQYLKVKNRRPVITHTFTDNFLTNPITSLNPLKMILAGKSKADEIKQKKVVISPYSDSETKKKYWIQYQFKTKPMDFCFRNSEKVLFEANIYLNQINAEYKLDPKKGDCLPVGVDLDFIEQHLSQGNMFINRQAMGFKEDDIVLLTVNRLAADKGVDKIVLALSELIKINPKIKFLMIGSGYQENEIYKIIADRNLQEYVRHFKDVPEHELYFYYRLADIYLSVFSYPGSSLSSMEAMACSLPLITTAQPWLIEEDKNGLVIQNNDPAVIQSAVLKLIDKNNLKQMGEESLRIVQRFHWKKIAAQGVRIYEQLLKVKL